MMPAIPHITLDRSGARGEEIAELRVEFGPKSLRAEMGRDLLAEKIRPTNIGMRMSRLQHRNDGVAELGRLIRVDEDAEFSITQRIHRAILVSCQDALATG